MKTTYLNLRKKLATALFAYLAIFSSVNANAQCNANFTFTVGAGGVVNFHSTSVGTSSNTNYSWNFGGGSYGYGINVSHTFSSNGYKNVCLNIVDSISGPCNSTKCDSVNVTTVTGSTCTPSYASFTYTLGASGLVIFKSTSTGTTATTNYLWSFGSGNYGSGATTSHTYPTNGVKNVCLYITDSLGTACSSSKCDSLTITSSGSIACAPSVVYSLYKDSTLALTWNAIPYYPSNISNATWYWGDGNSTVGLYPSHTYSAAGTYSTCVTISVSCGTTTATYCYVANIFKSTQNNAMITLNVKASVTAGIKANSNLLSNISIYPNPNNGEFNLDLSLIDAKTITVSIYDIIGQLVSQQTADAVNKKMNASQLQNGTYFIKINADNKTTTQKIIINK